MLNYQQSREIDVVSINLCDELIMDNLTEPLLGKNDDTPEIVPQANKGKIYLEKMLAVDSLVKQLDQEIERLAKK